MRGFLVSVLSDFLGGLLVAGVMAIITYVCRSRRGYQVDPEYQGGTGAGIASMVSQFIEQQAQALRRQQVRSARATEHRIVVEHREYSAPSGEEPWWLLAGILALIIIADTIWVKYRVEMLYIVLGGVGVGMGISYYYIIQLGKVRPPYAWEDIILSWGGLAIWSATAVTAIVAVHFPLYTEPTGDWTEWNLSFIHAVQLIGMALLPVTIAAMGSVQVVAGRVYEKALQHHTPNRIEIFIWDMRMWIFAGVVLLTALGFLFGTGILFRSLSASEATQAAEPDQGHEGYFSAQGTPFAIEASRTVTISRASAVSMFDGELTIAVIEASKYFNQVTAVISSPGFEELRLEKQQVGYRVIYDSNAKYEIQVMDASDESSLSIPPAAVFRVIRAATGTLQATRSTTPIPTIPVAPTPTATPVLIEASETITISRAGAGSVFGGELTIAVIDASNFYNYVTALISSPGFPEVKIDRRNVGFKVAYVASAKYEVQIMGVVDGSYASNTPTVVEFTVTRFRE